MFECSESQGSLLNAERRGGVHLFPYFPDGREANWNLIHGPPESLDEPKGSHVMWKEEEEEAVRVSVCTTGAVRLCAKEDWTLYFSDVITTRSGVLACWQVGVREVTVDRPTRRGKIRTEHQVLFEIENAEIRSEKSKEKGLSLRDPWLPLLRIFFHFFFFKSIMKFCRCGLLLGNTHSSHSHSHLGSVFSAPLTTLTLRTDPCSSCFVFCNSINSWIVWRKYEIRSLC